VSKEHETGASEREHAEPADGAAQDHGVAMVDVRSAVSVEQWLVRQIAAHLAIATSEVHVEQPLSCFAIDSVVALELMEQLEDSLGYVISPTIFYQQPATIRALAERLTARRRNADGAAAA